MRSPHFTAAGVPGRWRRPRDKEGPSDGSGESAGRGRRSETAERGGPRVPRLASSVVPRASNSSEPVLRSRVSKVPGSATSSVGPRRRVPRSLGMASDRFHKAAREDAVWILHEATKKDSNAKDELGMTPTLWAAYAGRVEALTVLIAKGGDPEKTDNFGNTALHLAAGRGHEYCVQYLVKLGCNIWALDIDRHSACQLASINGRERIRQFLDMAQTHQELQNRKRAKMQRERAEKDAEKRLKEYMKRERDEEIKAEKELKRLLKDRAKLDEGSNRSGVLPHRPSILTFKGRVKPSPTFSDIVGTATKRHGSAVGRKAMARKALDDFKVVEVEVDGKRSVRSLTGFRRDSEVMYVGTYETQAQQQGRRGRVSDVWGTLGKAQSTPDLLGDRGFSEEEEEDPEDEEIEPRIAEGSILLQEPTSIFAPGFGSVAFRRSASTTLDTLPMTQVDVHRQSLGGFEGSTNGSINGLRKSTNGLNEEVSIGSAGSLARRQSIWEDDPPSDDEEETDEEWTPLQRFLAANNLTSIQSILEAEQIDLEALMLLTEADVGALKLPLGPRRKLTNAIANRKKALEAPETVIRDSRL
ncbi:Usher syndrome type-1G protein homolog [Orussus abietinus]|uniref:Usher syndrome type-1G protein homolog n=1 Tax=Orussus abietinus TaxID=222816 RepID=UPI000625899F|nr:Usher syndrome type-1G protein homolog [Orussus abietinus]